MAADQDLLLLAAMTDHTLLDRQAHVAQAVPHKAFSKAATNILHKTHINTE